MKLGRVMKIPSGMAIATTRTVDQKVISRWSVMLGRMLSQERMRPVVESKSVYTHTAATAAARMTKNVDQQIDLVTDLRYEGGAVLGRGHRRGGHALAD